MLTISLYSFLARKKRLWYSNIFMIMIHKLGMLSAWLLLTWNDTLEICILRTQVHLKSLYFTIQCM